MAIAFALMGLASTRNTLKVRGSVLSQRSVIRFKDFDLTHMSYARLFRAAGCGNSRWELRLRAGSGPTTRIRLNGFRAADRQQLTHALEPYFDRPEVQAEGPFAEALAGTLVASRQGLMLPSATIPTRTTERSLMSRTYCAVNT